MALDSEELRLCYLPAHEVLGMFRAGQLSPREHMEILIKRAELVEPIVNAFTYKHYDRALQQAKDAEQVYAKTDGKPRALEGLAVAVKDSSCIAGEPTSKGSLLLQDYVPDFTSPVNERVLAAGAIVHARTATPEFACAGYTWSRLWGVTRNPWNPEFTPGGSSGGAAAALAAGTTALATGSDIAGSIRIPASASGVCGFKPTYGRNPVDSPLNLDPYCHTGPLARTPQDCILLQNVMCGPHPADIATIHPRLELPMEYPDLRGMSIALSEDLDIFEVDPEVVHNLHAVADTLRTRGATVTPVSLGWKPTHLEAALAHLEHIFGASIESLIPDDRWDDLTSYVRQFAERGRNSSANAYVQALEAVNDMYQSLGAAFQQHQALLCPTLAVPAVAADFDQSQDELTINGKPVNTMLGWLMTWPFNMCSRCPVLSVPSGFASNGVPTGVQFVAAPYADSIPFQLAHNYYLASPELAGTTRWPAHVEGRSSSE